MLEWDGSATRSRRVRNRQCRVAKCRHRLPCQQPQPTRQSQSSGRVDRLHGRWDGNCPPWSVVRVDLAALWEALVGYSVRRATTCSLGKRSLLINPPRQAGFASTLHLQSRWDIFGHQRPIYRLPFLQPHADLWPD